MLPDDPDDDLVAPVPTRPLPSTAPPLVVRGRDALVAGRRDWRVGVVALVLVSVVAGWLWYRAGAAAVPPAVAVDGAPTTTTAAADTAGAGGAPGADAGDGGAVGSSTTSAPAAIVVHVAGAVAAPGVHPLTAGARVGDAIAAAGGALADADLDRLNLATVLADGQRVDVPRRDDPPEFGGVSGTPPAPGGPAPPGGGGAVAGPVDLNRATAAELDGLPGVGPSIAAAIIAYREEHGAFGAVEELLEVRGIGEARLAELRPLVAV